MAFAFNGTSVTFTPAIGEIRSVTFDEVPREIEVSNSSDTNAIFEMGLVDTTATVEINGTTTAVAGTTNAAFSVSWNDGTTSSMTLGIVGSINITGSLDQPITSTVTFKNTQ